MNGNRVNQEGHAYAGSQRQVQAYVNRRRAELNKAIMKELSSYRITDIQWVSPLDAEKFTEYKDTDFLNVLGLNRVEKKLKKFWPAKGPVWDALATIDFENSDRGVILVEAKSHRMELFSTCMAASNESKKIINASLSLTKAWFGVDPNKDWTRPLYQFANRLAHLHFLRQICGIKAWLVNIYFINDPYRPTSRKQWNDFLREVRTELGLNRSFQHNHNCQVDPRTFCLDLFLLGEST